MEKLRPLCNGPFKIIIKRTEVTSEVLTQNGKTFHKHRNRLIPYYPKDPFFLLLIESYIEENRVTFIDSDTSKKLRNDSYSSNNKFEMNDNLFDDDPLCNDYEGTSATFDNELHKSVDLDGDNHHFLRSKSDSDCLNYKPRSSKFHSVNRFLEIFDFLDNNTVHDSPTSFVDKSNFSLHFIPSQDFNKKTKTKLDLRPQGKKLLTFFPLLSTPLK